MQKLTRVLFEQIQKEYLTADIASREQMMEQLLSYENDGNEVSKHDKYDLFEKIGSTIHKDKLATSKQVCPICGTIVVEHHRFPHYVCGKCMSHATNTEGRSVTFYNQDMGGGCIAYYSDSYQTEKYDSDICYINNVRCIAQEGKFGGIFISPV